MFPRAAGAEESQLAAFVRRLGGPGGGGGGLLQRAWALQRPQGVTALQQLVLRVLEERGL